MSAVHNSTITRPSARTEPSATEVQTSKASNKQSHPDGMAVCRAATSIEHMAAPAVLTSALLTQPIGSEAEKVVLMRAPPSSCAGATRVELHQGAAAVAAATVAATTLRNRASVQATISAFAAAATAQAAQNAQAILGTPMARRMRQAPGIAQAAPPGSPCGATLLVEQSRLLNNLYHRREHGRRSQAALAVPSTTSAGGASNCSSLPNDGSSCNAINSRRTGSGSGGYLPGAAYFLIPQPAYHDDHHPPQARSKVNCSGSISSSKRTTGRTSIATARARTMHSERKQVSSRATAGAMDMTMIRPAKIAKPAASKRRYRGGTSEFSLCSGSLHKTGVERRHQQPGFVEGGGTAGTGDSGDFQGESSMSAEARLERSREQNRQSSKKARMRRKGEEESLMEQIQTIQSFRLMVEEGPDMMSIHDLDHRAPFRFASSAFQRIAGIDPESVLGRGLTDLIAAEDHVVVQQTLLKVVFSQASGNIVSYRMLTPGGGSLRVETSIRAGDQCIICVTRVVSRNPSLPLQRPPQAIARERSSLSVKSGNGGGIKNGGNVGDRGHPNGTASTNGGQSGSSGGRSYRNGGNERTTNDCSSSSSSSNCKDSAKPHGNTDGSTFTVPVSKRIK